MFCCRPQARLLVARHYSVSREAGSESAASFAWHSSRANHSVPDTAGEGLTACPLPFSYQARQRQS